MNLVDFLLHQKLISLTRLNCVQLQNKQKHTFTVYQKLSLNTLGHYPGTSIPSVLH